MIQKFSTKTAREETTSNTWADAIYLFLFLSLFHDAATNSCYKEWNDQMLND
jgi:hypothetical protein